MLAVVTNRADRPAADLDRDRLRRRADRRDPFRRAARGAPQIVGSGQGSVGTRDILAELPALAEQITNGTFDIDARAVPLADVEQAWADAADTNQRIVRHAPDPAGGTPSWRA